VRWRRWGGQPVRPREVRLLAQHRDVGQAVAAPARPLRPGPRRPCPGRAPPAAPATGKGPATGPGPGRSPASSPAAGPPRPARPAPSTGYAPGCPKAKTITTPGAARLKQLPSGATRPLEAFSVTFWSYVTHPGQPGAPAPCRPNPGQLRCALAEAAAAPRSRQSQGRNHPDQGDATGFGPVGALTQSRERVNFHGSTVPRKLASIEVNFLAR
jgi:hypothetical protein